MFFKDYLNSVANCLDAKLQGYKQQDHSGDVGELCEYFIKDFLLESFSGNLRVFRGGRVIDSGGNKSEQIDIVLCSQNSIKIFSDKGLYPIETVFGVINVKKELNYTNLFSLNSKDCGVIKNLKSIPKENIKLHPGILKKDKVDINFKIRFPCKIVFAYSGNIIDKWEKELNDLVSKDSTLLEYLPDLIIVNKMGMIKKMHNGTAVYTTGEEEQKFFHFTSFKESELYQIPYVHILNELYKNAGWQYYISPAYEEYFNQDF